MSSALQSAIEALYGLERRRSDFRVEDTARLLAELGDPHRQFRSVHVAGTNGKGSVCAMVERALRAAGVRTGLTVSPHLVDYRERIRVSGRWLAESELERRLERLQALDAARGRTFFEITTALAFDAFARHGVEWGVVEVGLGGRLDATNVLESEVCALTSVALDHTEILGDTLEQVAREKAGIFKPGVPVVAGALPAAARAEAGAVAKARGAPWLEAQDRVQVKRARAHVDGGSLEVECAPWGALELDIGLRGAHQLDNAAVALAVLSVLADRGLALPAEPIREGFRAARWPGRLEPCPGEPRLWWDGAHNPAGLERVTASWRRDLELPAPQAIVLAVSRDKPAVQMLSVLETLAPGATLFATRTRNERALAAETLALEARGRGWRVQTRQDVGDAVAEALAGTRGRVLLVGSLFAVGEAMRRFGGAPLETA